MNLSLLLGLFGGYYIGNPKFKQTVDKSIQGIMASGIDSLNKMGNGQNVPTQPEQQQ